MTKIYKLQTIQGKVKILLNAEFGTVEEAEKHAQELVSIDPQEDWHNIYEVVEIED